MLLKVAPKNNNWGDMLSPILIKHMTGIDMPTIYGNTHRTQKHLIAIGSLLRWANKNTTVWGTGFLSKSMKPKSKPHICAVRGPATRNRLIELGIHCPKIYGDPALLYSRFHNPEVECKFDLGIVPHYAEKGLYDRFKDETLIIDICAGIKEVVRQIKSCKLIASSSLHGLIIADAYDIPSLWIQTTNKILGKGFKFIDYFRSVQRKDKNPLLIDKNVNIEQIKNNFTTYSINIDLDKLESSFPKEIFNQ